MKKIEARHAKGRGRAQRERFLSNRGPEDFVGREQQEHHVHDAQLLRTLSICRLGWRGCLLALSCA
jgi:hypothetical protein